jgi:hypothetical protein
MNLKLVFGEFLLVGGGNGWTRLVVGEALAVELLFLEVQWDGAENTTAGFAVFADSLEDDRIQFTRGAVESHFSILCEVDTVTSSGCSSNVTK